MKAGAQTNKEPADPLTLEGIPEGWALAQLEDVSKAIQYGFTASAVQGQGPRLLRITDIQNGNVDWSTVPTCHITKVDAEKYGLRSGDIVFARTGATTGKSFLIGSCPPAVFASYLIRVRVHDCLYPAFLASFFNTPQYWEFITDNVAGNAQPNCNASKLAALKVPIAPSAEQARIVSKIEELLKHVNASREHLAKVPKILRAFRQSVLAAACSGRLTEDWRAVHGEAIPASTALDKVTANPGTPKIRRGVPEEVPISQDASELDPPETWAKRSAASMLRSGALVDVKDGNHGANHPKRNEFGNRGLPFITAAQVQDFTIDYESAPKVDRAALTRLRVGFASVGDAVLTHKGTVGRAALNTKECVLSPQTTYYRCNPQVLDARYLVLFFSSPQFFHQLAAVMSQTTRDFVPISEQYRLFHLIPPIEEQHEIVRRVEILFKLADKIEKRVGAGTKRADKLTQSILARAFRGELVPTEAELARRQARDYEAASVLLDRIKAERARLTISSNGASRRGPKRARK